MVHISLETVSKEETCFLSSLLLKASEFGEEIQSQNREKAGGAWGPPSPGRP